MGSNFLLRPVAPPPRRTENPAVARIGTLRRPSRLRQNSLNLKEY
jgi:hypothetical protein